MCVYCHLKYVHIMSSCKMLSTTIFMIINQNFQCSTRGTDNYSSITLKGLIFAELIFAELIFAELILAELIFRGINFREFVIFENFAELIFANFEILENQ